MNTQLGLIFIGAAVLALIFAANNWRHGFLIVLVLGFTQDVLRKITPGEPVELVLLSSLMVLVVMVVAMRHVGLINLRPLTQGDRTALVVWTFFVALVIVQAMMSFVRFKSITIPAIGIISYLSPIPAIWLAYKYARDTRDLAAFLKLYVLLGVVACGSVVLQKMGIQSIIFEEVGDGLQIYDVRVGLMEAYNGILRTPEVAAWHLGTAAALVIVLAVSVKRFRFKWLTPGLVIALLLTATLTGRRKSLIVVACFAAVYFMMLVYFRQRSGMRALFFSAFGAVILAGGVLVMAPEESAVDPYVGRSTSVFADATDRLQRMGLWTVVSAVEAAGPWGIGAGAVGQGTQHVGGASGRIRYAAEGGLGKITGELGLPGLGLAILAVVFLAKSIRNALRRVADEDMELARLNIGLLAICIGNLPVFVGASQIYGDPFVLFMLGSLVGFVLAGPRILQIRQRRQARVDARGALQWRAAAVG